MICPSQISMIEQSDFDCVGNVAKHCDLPKLCIAIQEAQEWDLNQLFCDLDLLSTYEEIDKYRQDLEVYEECLLGDNPEECVEPIEPDDYELKVNLFCGGTYESCSGKTKRHLGIKRVLVYYAYSRYVILNGFSDTPNGIVNKTNEFSIPKSLNELEKFSDKYRTMGYESAKGVKDFLCRNKDVFTDFNDCDCKSCGCANGCCDSRTKAKGYGYNGRIIEK